MLAEFIGQSDGRYGGVDRMVSEVYIEEIGVSPTSHPPWYLALYDGLAVAGAVGLWPGEEKNPFLTELYCRRQGVNPVLAVPGLAGLKRSEIAEMGGLCMLKYYRKDFLPQL